MNPGLTVATWDEDDPLSHPFTGPACDEIFVFCYMARESHRDRSEFLSILRPAA